AFLAPLGPPEETAPGRGRAAAPAFDSRVGNGASYAATTASFIGLATDDAMTRPTGRSSPARSANVRQRMKPGLGQSAPPNSPVLSTTRRAKRSFISTAAPGPIGPPQPCTTTVAPRTSRCSIKAFIDSV